MAAIRMLLVGDNVDFVEGLRDWLVREPDVEIVGIEHSGQAAIDRITDAPPRVVLMDVTMNGMSGFEACRRIRSVSTVPSVILMTFHESDTVCQESWAAGADAVVGKGQIADTLLPLVRGLVSPASSTDPGKSPRKGPLPQDPAP